MDIKELLIISGLSRKEFCEKYHVKTDILSKWMTGSSSPADTTMYLLERCVFEDAKDRLAEDTSDDCMADTSDDRVLNPFITTERKKQWCNDWDNVTKKIIDYARG